MIVLFFDSSFSNIPYSIGGFQSIPVQHFTILIFVIIFSVTQYLVMSMIKEKISHSDSNINNSLLKKFHILVTLLQHVISILLFVIVIEVLFYSYYSKLFLISILVISYCTSSIVLAMLGIRFFFWFRSKKSFSIFLYGLTSILFGASNLFVMVFITSTLQYVGDFISSHGHFTYYSQSANIYQYFLYFAYQYGSIVSFVLTWMATITILHYYSNRIGKINFWILVSLPLIYFLSQFNPILIEYLIPLISQNIYLYLALVTIIFSMSKAAGGLLFGLAFWIMARRLNQFSKLKPYVVMVSLGFMLLFASEQAISLLALPYPPYGLVSIATLGLSSYLIFLGLFYSAVVISSDVQLRKSIRDKTLNDLSFLSRIGTAENEKETEKTVMNIVKKKISDQKPAVQYSDGDMIEYVNEVMEEIRIIRDHKM